MGIKEHRVSVKVIKRVQEYEFEPFEIQLEEHLVYDQKIKNPKKARRKLYNIMEKELDDLIEERLED